MADNAPVLIAGTGAMACLMGARLARAGCHVTLAGRWEEALRAIAADGVRVADENGEWSARVSTRRVRSTNATPASHVLVLVKGHQTASVADWVAEAVSPEASVLTLQNGLGHAQTLARACAHALVSSGLAYVGATLVGPGVVRHAGGERVVVDGLGHARWGTLLGAAGFMVERVEDIAPHVWAKLAVNCAINPLTALHRVPNGALLDRPELRAELVAAAEEVGRLAAALGVDLPAPAAQLACDAARLTAANRSSMLQDVERGRPSEIESLNGAVLREAQRVGLPMPVVQRLHDAVRALDAHAVLEEDTPR